MIDSTTVTHEDTKLVLSAMDGILVEHSTESVKRNFHPDFVQHNPWAKDGSAHVEQMCAFEFGVRVNRAVAQGDLVAYHGIYTAPNPLGDLPLLCTDVWRVQGNQIVEHWDALAPVPADAVESLTGGPGNGEAAVDPATVAANAALVRRILEGTASEGDVAKGFGIHGPRGGDGAALSDWLGARSVEIRMTVASGDLVMAQLDTRTGEQRTVVYAWFRVEGGTATDLWVVEQPFVSEGEAATNHPHF